MQSTNAVFLLEIILTRENKESFKLFDDMFQFFRLASVDSVMQGEDETTLNKYGWEKLNDLLPLYVTSKTDMSADWKHKGVGGSCKTTKRCCTLCPLKLSCVHLLNPELCNHFCREHDDLSWKCYHHEISCLAMMEDLDQAVAELMEAIMTDLEVIEQESKRKKT